MDYLDREVMERKERIEELTQLFGRKLFAIVHKESQSIWKPFFWKQFPMKWFGRNETLRNQLLKFVGKYPTLKTQEEKFDCFKTCFLGELKSPPFIFKTVQVAKNLPFGTKLITAVIDMVIRSVARHFIVGNSRKEILKAVKKLEKTGASCNLDVLGEEVFSNKQADDYLEKYFSLLQIVKSEVSLKPSGLCSWFDCKEAVESMKTRLRRIFKEGQTGVAVDIEQYRYRDLTFEIFKEVLSGNSLRDFRGAGIAFQTYLRDWKNALEELIDWAKEENRQIKIRLVKGAYWDYEVLSAKEESRPIPVFTEKWQSDLAFEEACEFLMANKSIRDNIKVAVASHNIRSVAKAMALAEVYGFPKERLEFQVLYGMGYPLMKAITKMGYPVKVYVATGDLVAGVAFLVRRIIENTSQTSFVFQSFSGNVSVEELLKNPTELKKP